jgi:hypothetical protein
LAKFVTKTCPRFYGAGMGAGIDQEKQRARWRRNKSAERARSTQYAPQIPSPEFVARVMEERDRRLAVLATPGEYPYELWAGLESYRVPGTWQKVDSKTQRFLADVWVARTLLKHQFGRAGATAIAKWLTESGCNPGYAKGSLRVMVTRALDRIVLLETTAHYYRDEAFWPPFSAVD